MNHLWNDSFSYPSNTSFGVEKKQRVVCIIGNKLRMDFISLGIETLPSGNTWPKGPEYDSLLNNNEY